MTTEAVKITGNLKGLMKSTVERVEKLEAEKQGIADDIKKVYAEAKAAGLDTKALKHVVKLRKQDKEARDEFEALVDLYRDVFGI